MKATKEKPDYKAIYTDLINKKYPERVNEFQYYLQKKTLKRIDVIKLNNKILIDYNIQDKRFNQKFRSYQEEEIIEILRYQQKKQLNNTQLAKKFNLSRNTVTKWKKIFI